MLSAEMRPLACQKRGCEMTVRLEHPETRAIRYQHGENPEAVLEVSFWEQGIVHRATFLAFMERDGRPVPPSVVDDWVERVHAYEDGEAPE